MCVCVCKYWIKGIFIEISVPKSLFHFNTLTITRIKGRLPKRHIFSISPCEFMADDLTRLFYLFFSNDGYWSGSKGVEGNWLRNSSMVKEEGFPPGPQTGVVCSIWISLSIRGHLPSHHHCQTLFCRQRDALVLPFARRTEDRWCTAVMWAYRVNRADFIQGADDDMKVSFWQEMSVLSCEDEGKISQYVLRHCEIMTRLLIWNALFYL